MDVFFEIEKLFSSRNSEKWNEFIDLKDPVAARILSKWFNNICSENVMDIQTVKISKMRINNRFLLRFRLDVCYYDNKKISEIVEFEIKKNSHNEYKIVNVYTPPRIFDTSIKRVQIWKEICGVSAKYKDDRQWHDYSDYIIHTANLQEHISANRYAKSICRSIIARESNPQIECGILLSCILSKKVYYLSRKYLENVVLDNPLIEELYDQFINDFEVSMYNKERIDTWESKFTTSWRGIDELLFEQNSSGSIVKLNCHTFMSLFYCILLLSGIDKCNLTLANAEHQVKLFIQNGSENYIMQRNNIYSFSEKPFIGAALPSRLYGMDWMMSARCSFIAPEYRKKISSHINDIAWFWKDKFVFAEPQNAVKEDINLNENHENIISSILKARAYNGDSIYNWAMYCFQTLYVPQPNVYVISSICSKLVKKYTEDFNESQFMTYFKALPNMSIFLESHRIMSAEQTVLYGCADYKSKALLYYTYYYFKGQRGCIVWFYSNYRNGLGKARESLAATR